MLVDQYGRPMQATPPKAVRVAGRYDSAAYTDENRRHWGNADALSAVTANSASVRRTLRMRSRYEYANNSWLNGVISTISAYTIGTGPTLQLGFRTEETKAMRQACSIVEQMFSDWAYSRNIAQKLVTMQQALDVDGEAFALITSSPKNKHTPIELDFRLYEADHFDNYLPGANFIGNEAGIEIDSAGNPTRYAFTETHPGDSFAALSGASGWKSASEVIHLFRQTRPGQLRGIPRTTPALPLFALLRRFTLATVTAAEFAASISGIISQESSDGSDSAEPFERIEFERNALMTLPGGSRLSQLESEHPSSTMPQFVDTLLCEICRCLCVPTVIAKLSAIGYNYASGRLDMQAFWRTIEIERAHIICRLLLDRIFEEWLDEALLVNNYLPQLFVEFASELSWLWRWPSLQHVDRAKEASGQAAELAANTTTLAREYARQGLDWEVELRQRARELALMKELGLPASTATQAAPTDTANEADKETNLEEDTADA